MKVGCLIEAVGLILAIVGVIMVASCKDDPLPAFLGIVLVLMGALIADNAN